ncbi:hypothetical protein Tco_0816943 [Tanacetum coccineum]
MLLLFMREANGSFADKNDEVHCDVGVHHNNRPNTPQKAIESGYHLRLKYEGGTKTSGFMAKQNPVFQHRDSNGMTPAWKTLIGFREVLKLQAMIRGKPMQQDVSNELKNTQQLNSYIVDKSAKIGEGSLLGPCGRFRCQDSPDVHACDDVYNNASVVLPPKEIKASILKPEIVKVRILQKSQENGQSRTNTDTGKEREYKSRENAIKGQPKSTHGQH